MIVWVMLGVVATAAALFLAGRLTGGGRFVARPLLELGMISMPARLEPRAADETPARVLFHFDRVAGGFSMMGSHTPIRERLTVAVWPADAERARTGWEREFRALAADRVGDIAWRREGELEIGTGVHRVNANEAPATVLIRALPDRGLALGYMVWNKDAPLDKATATLDRIAASYAPALERDTFFAVVRERPAKLIAGRREFLAAALAQHGVALEFDAPPVVHDGIAFHLSTEQRGLEGAWFFAMTAIGDLPAGPRPFRHRRPPPPDGLSAWPDILYFVHSDGRWQRKAIDRDYAVPAALQPWVDVQLSDPTRAYFFAVHGIAVDEASTSEFGLERLWTAPARMRGLLSAGELVIVPD